jgi:hypothetical protein
MSGTEAHTAADLEKARVIVGEYGLTIGPAGKLTESIVRAVADGIALGRKEALAQDALAQTAKSEPKGTRGR